MCYGTSQLSNCLIAAVAARPHMQYCAAEWKNLVVIWLAHKEEPFVWRDPSMSKQLSLRILISQRRVDTCKPLQICRRQRLRSRP